MRTVWSIIAILAFANFSFAIDKPMKEGALRYNDFAIFGYNEDDARLSHRYKVNLNHPANLQVVDFRNAGKCTLFKITVYY